MRKMIALLVSIAFSLTVAGLAVAQPKPATEAGKAAAPGQEQKEKVAEKKVAKKETKASCLKAAKDDDTAKAECEKKFVAKKTEKKQAKAEKKHVTAGTKDAKK
ncbi:MAG: hypothetical protein HYY95_18260 [Candidatus Rokubacteria bacterium]|nr:hypothetical protein [Candidatus Rokubacteria bacterium]